MESSQSQHYKSEYIQGKIDCNNMDAPKKNVIHRTSKTIESGKVKEKSIFYEWCVRMFSEKIPNIIFLVKDDYDSIGQLKENEIQSS